VKKLIAITALASGVLLLLVPRYILPACEYEGYAHMHCSDTALAEYAVGLILMAIGVASLFLKTEKLLAGAALASVVLYGVSYWLPDHIGYCRNTRMPCNYGMVPGVRFIAIVGIILMAAALAGIVKTYRAKGKA
jgi:hypothetical protein